MNILEELTWRDLIANSTDVQELNSYFKSSGKAVYLGIDPTGDSLHAGHLVPLITMLRFQKFGFKPLLLLGGATAQIGDPREVGERVLQSQTKINANVEKITSQLTTLFDFQSTDSQAELLNNLDWTKETSAIEFLRDIGKNFSVNVMLSRDLVKRRLADDGLSFTEFSYPLLQANDYWQLYKSYACLLQIGGADQWANLISGIDLIRRKGQVIANGLTVPLVTNADGSKFGKTTGGGNLWLDPEKTSPYDWYQFFINVDDKDVIRFLKWFTFYTKEEISALEKSMMEEPHLRKAQQALADSLTTLVHGEKTTVQVKKATAALFGKAEFDDLDPLVLESALAATSLLKVSAASFNLSEILVSLGLASSKGQARKLIADGGFYVNNNKIPDIDWQPGPSDWIAGKLLVVRRGKKNFAGIKLEK